MDHFLNNKKVVGLINKSGGFLFEKIVVLVKISMVFKIFFSPKFVSKNFSSVIGFGTILLSDLAETIQRPTIIV